MLDRQTRYIEKMAWFTNMLQDMDRILDDVMLMKQKVYLQMHQAAVDQLDDHGASTSADTGSSPVSGTSDNGPSDPVSVEPKTTAKTKVVLTEKPKLKASGWVPSPRRSKKDKEPKTWADDRGHSAVQGAPVGKPGP